MRLRFLLASLGITLGLVGVRPGTAQPPAAAPTPEAPHPWAIAPNHGEWMVCVKSYTGPEAQAQAESLAKSIRDPEGRNAAAFLYEWGAEERQRQEKLRAERLAERAKEFAPFIQTQAALKAEAERNGQVFSPTPVVVRVPVVSVKTQWAVLIGGWKTMDQASAALRVIRTWPAPTDTTLLDQAVVNRPGQAAEGAYINPFATAIVVPNPSIRKTQSTEVPVDPVIVKLNAEEPYSLLKVSKPWTLMVKDFPVQTVTQMHGQDGGVVGRLLGSETDEAAKMLDRTAEDAREFAKVIRGPEMQAAFAKEATRLGLPLGPLEAYVLHVQTGSRVTIGQFDSLDDPGLQAAQQLLTNMYFEVRQSKTDVAPQKRRIFNGIGPMPVPGRGATVPTSDNPAK